MVSEKNIFSVFPIISTGANPWGVARLDTHGLDWQDLCRGSLNIATYTKYMWASWFQRRRFFEVFPIISLCELYIGMAATLIYGPVTICTNFQSPFNTRLHMKFEEIWPRGFRGEVVQRCERMDRQTDEQMDGWLAIPTIQV